MAPQPIKKSHVITLIRNLCDEYATQRDAAIDMGTTPQTLSSVINGRRRPTASMLAAVGVNRTEVYFADEVPIAYIDQDNK